MKKHLRLRFWIELAIALLNLGILTCTFLWPQWIELAFNIDPDAGSGAAEWWLVAATAAISITCFVLMRIEWRRLSNQPAVVRGI
jgi:hypothetical protein